MEIKKLPLRQKDNKELRVAAYCRVSTQSEKQSNSLSNQVSYYNELIQKTPGWTYAGVFYDNGISGTSTFREGFQRMLKACRDGEIDIVITKSISRFARNTVDLLRTVRELKEVGIEVRFERERINSMSGDGELMLSLLASFAQAESENLSQNVRWAIQNGFKEGHTHCHKLFGYRWHDGIPVIEESEAEVVRYIFAEALKSVPPSKIADSLGMSRSSVEMIINQRKYTGDEILQQYYRVLGTRSRKRNRGELPMYLVQGALPAIISRETYDSVHERMTRNRRVQWAINKGFEISCFSSKIKCGECGRNYVKTYNNNDRTHPIWTCRGRHKFKDCKAERIAETDLRDRIAKAMGLAEFDEERFNNEVKQVIVTGQKVRIVYAAESDQDSGNETAI